jgi:anti-sigma regulatory factor (Ser/Thr protein kinase)
VETLAPLLTAALEAGDVVQAVVPMPRADQLSAALGSKADRVTFIDAEVWYRRPGMTITQYDDVLHRLDGQRALVIGEVQFGSSSQQWSAWTRYESVLNASLARYDARVICPYDTQRLPEQVVAWAARTHPNVMDSARRQLSRAYDAPASLLPELPNEATVPPRPADLQLVATTDAAAVRAAVASACGRAGFDQTRTDELVLAVNEVVSNAIVHGAGAATVSIWCDESALTCMVADDGNGLDDPLAGYRRPGAGAEHGYGLWLARQLFDCCAFATGDGGGMVATMTAFA